MPQTAFIARDNESLLAAATECLKKAIPFVILGKNIAGDVIKTIPSLTKIQVKSFPSVAIKQMLDKFDIEYEREKEKNQYKASESDKLEQLAEITGIMHICVEQFAYNKAIEEIEKLKRTGKDNEYFNVELLKEQLKENLSVQNLVNWMKETFSGVDVDHLNKEQKEELEKKMKEMNITTITSAHRSKGFEFKRVYILRNDKLGSNAEKEDETGKKTIRRSDKKSETAEAEDDIQEENIKYVAYSRAEDELHIIKIQGQPGVKDE
jgi:superfamily I DNA/RNA helicase